VLVGDKLGVLVASDVDVDDAAGVDVGWEEDGRELDLRLLVLDSWLQAGIEHEWLRVGTPTSRLSSVSSTATPASTLPTVNETSMAGCCVGG